MRFLFEIRAVNGIGFNEPSWIKNAKSIYHRGIFRKEHNYTQNRLIFANACRKASPQQRLANNVTLLM